MSSSLLLLRQLQLLLRKNFILQIRRPIGTVFELLIPVLALALAVVIGYKRSPGRLPETNSSCFTTFQSNFLQVPQKYGTIYYAPDTTNATAIMQFAIQQWPQLNGSLIGVANGTELQKILLNLTNEYTPGVCDHAGIAGVYFDNVDTKDIQYTLRFPYEEDWASDQVTDMSSANTYSLYMMYGFINLQRIVEQSIIAFITQGQTTVDVDLSMRQFPYPPIGPRTNDEWYTNICIPLLLMLAFMYTFAQIVKELVIEKESRIRESMLMMGLRLWVLWTTWFIKQLLFMSIWVVAFSVILKFLSVWPESDVFLLLIFFLLYTTSTIAFGFLVSVWFNSPLVSLVVSFIVFFLSFLPNYFIYFCTNKIPYGGKLALGLLSNTAFGLGVNVISSREWNGVGLQWSNVADPLSTEEPLNMGAVFGMMICDIILYMLIAWYVDAVKPGRYGVPKPFYFPFLPSYWTGKPWKRFMGTVEESSGWHDPQAHEEQPRGLKAGINIQNLTKIYDQRLFNRRTRNVAVDELSLNMYEGQITALLGHNGAGKTTTISILTGLYTPTAGTAVINGYGIRSNMDQIRHSLGICPQHNVLLDRLTVREHLKLFAMLKGMPSKDVQQEIDSMLRDLHLMDQKKTAAKNLSGGMKRKLSVGIALIGGSKTVVLDEPTSGMDPYARRATWDLLTKHKEGRTMLLTTHFMDEADLLGDRIAIMADGKLMCSGSSLFLKSKYGVGYHLTLVRGPACDSRGLSELITSTVPGSQLASDVSAELTFLLPFTSSQHFPTLLDTLEQQQQRLGFTSFGVSLTTLEGVFMKVGTGSTEINEKVLSWNSTTTSGVSFCRPLAPTDPLINEEHHPAAHSSQQQEVRNISPMSLGEEDDIVHETGHKGYHKLVDGYSLIIVHWGLTRHFSTRELFCGTSSLCMGLFMKRFYNSFHAYIIVFSQLVLPLIFILLGLILMKICVPPFADTPRRELTLQKSALSKNVTTFWAQFGHAPKQFDFANVAPELITATNFFDYTARAQNIKDKVQNYSTISDCCGYKYQLLDKFCASQLPVAVYDLKGETLGMMLCSLSSLQNDYKDNCENYSYGECTFCLKCCVASYATAALSCSSTPNAGVSSYCPAPPQLNVDDYFNNSVRGPLDSDNTYIAEVLLRVADDLQPSAFFREVQAGFVVSYQEPALSFCALSNDTESKKLSALLDVFYNSSAFNFPTPDCSDDLTNCEENIDDCQYVLDNCITNAILSNVTSIPGDYYTKLSYDMQSSLDDFACPYDPFTTSSSVAQIYPVQDNTMTVTIWYNNQAIHMVASALNTFHNIFLNQVVGDGWSISAYNHPLPENKEDCVDDALNYGTAFGILGSFGVALLISSFVVFPVQERKCKAKHLQFVSGVNPFIYWMANYAWDLINAVIIIIIAFLLIVAFQIDGYKTLQGMGAVFVLMVFTSWTGIPIAYCISFLFKSHLVAYGVLFLFFFFPALAFHLVWLRVSNNYAADILNYIFLLHPGYGLQTGLTNVYISAICRRSPKSPEPYSSAYVSRFYAEDIFRFDEPGIGSVLTYTTIEGLFLICLVIIIEYSIPYAKQYFLCCQGKNRAQKRYEPEVLEDDDVRNEKEKVMAERDGECDDIVVIRNLSKVYCPHLTGCSIAPSKRAVNRICLAIPRGEFFGFVGVNGAGKTTTFNMLLGDISPTSGTAIIAGHNIRTNIRKVRKQIGYCPQFDALIERMTGRELLTMFARLRGIPERHISRVVSTTITKLDLSKHANKQCGKYSGGNKRKLSIAIALIGDPPILFLDAPTAGTDPATRRYLWNVLNGISREGRTIILTTQSMEECEALCTRLTIMVNGEFKCLGSTQHLKSKYGAGYTLQAKVNPAMVIPENIPNPSSESPLLPLETNYEPQAGSEELNVSASARDMPRSRAHNITIVLKHFIEQRFHGARLLEECQGSVTYQLPSAGLTWSSVFHQLETNKERLGIIDYSVSQTTLDQVFINFAKLQDRVIE